MRKTDTFLRRVVRAAALAAAAAVCAAALTGCISDRINARLYPISYVEEIKTAADGNGLDRYLVAAVVATESGFKPDAVSGVGAEGLMQVLPSTAEWIAFRRGLDYSECDLFDPETNLDYGCWLLKFLLDRYDGSVRNALIAYNAGFGRLDEWLKTGADENGELKEIPYAETRNYVDKVMKYMKKYGELYEEELG